MERTPLSRSDSNPIRYDWLISLRWLGIITVFILIFLVRDILEFDYKATLWVASGMGLMNALGWWLNRHYEKNGPLFSSNETQIISQAQVFVDLIASGWMVWITGGSESPFISVFIAILPVVGLIHSRNFTFIISATAIIIIWSILWLDYFGYLTHIPFNFTSETISPSIEIYTILTLLLWNTLLITLVSITSVYVGGKLKAAVETERVERVQAETMQKMSADLSSTLDLYQALFLAKQHIFDLISYDYFIVAVNLGERFQTVTDFKSHKGRIPTIPEAHLLEIFQNVVDSGFDTSEDPTFWKEIGFMDSQSSFGSLLMARDTPIGLLALGTRAEGAYTPEHISLLQRIVERITLVLDNIHLYNQTLTLSITDPLTGLFNIRYFVETLEKEIVRSHRYEIPLSMLILDLDHFKVFNDQHGHLAGDEILRELADLLREQARESDTVARYGGEEFIILLPETSLEVAAQIAERLRQTVEKHEFFVVGESKPTRITLSLGASELSSVEQSASQLIKAADDALYDAKNWRNKVRTSEDTLGEL